MTIKQIKQILEEINDMKRSVEPTRESITAWYDWLSAIRDEQEFVKGCELRVRVLDIQLGHLVLMLVGLSVTL
jgi:hypothetical protein